LLEIEIPGFEIISETSDRRRAASPGLRNRHVWLENPRGRKPGKDGSEKAQGQKRTIKIGPRFRFTAFEKS